MPDHYGKQRETRMDPWEQRILLGDPALIQPEGRKQSSQPDWRQYIRLRVRVSG